MEEFYTAQEVADLLKIKKTTVYDLIKKQVIPATRVGKQFRVRKTDLDSWLGQEADWSSGEIAGRSRGTGKAGGSSVLKPAVVADAAENALRTRDYLRNNNGLIICGQEDLISLFCAYFQLEPDYLPVIMQSLNFYDSFYSLYFGKAHAVLSLVPQGDSFSCLVPGTELVSVQIAELVCGFYYKKEEIFPEGFSENLPERLIASHAVVMPGEKGSTFRIVMDNYLKKNGFSAGEINLCSRESISELTGAAAVDRDFADVSVGSSGILNQFPELQFQAFEKADVKLVFDRKFQEHPAFQGMIHAIQSDLFKRRLRQIEGYNCRNTGKVEIL